MTPPRRLHTITVRMPEDWHALFARAAHSNGVSVAAYFREAALIRWAFEASLAGAELDVPAEVVAVQAEIERLSVRLHELYGMPREHGP